MKPRRRAAAAFRWIWIVAGLAVAGAIALGVLWLNRPPVTVTRVVEGTVVNAFYATGTVEPDTEYPIKTSNAGTVTELLVKKGDDVIKGQKLAVVEDPQLLFQLDKATADLQQASERADEARSPVLREFAAKIDANAAMLQSAQREVQRMKEMEPRGGASKSDLDRATDHAADLASQGISLIGQRDAARLQLTADLEIARAARTAAEKNVLLQTLTSPINGKVLDRPAPAGTHLNVNVNDHVMQIADVRPQNLRMRAAVDEENIADAGTNQLVQMVLYSFPGKVFEGHVSRIYPRADTDRRTFEVDIEFAKPDDSLRAGMTGELAFIIQKKDNALIAPAQALQNGAIFTVHNGRLVRIDKPVIGIKSVERIEVLGGLQLGDPIVISPATDIRPGSPVRTTWVDPIAAAGANKAKESVQRNPLGGQ